MKYIIWFCFIVSLISIVCGYFLNVEYAQKLIGYGVLGFFFIVIPLFSWYSWKDKNPKDYMLTKENLDKMRDRENSRKNKQ